MEVVEFILRAVNDALGEHFGASISDEGVHVLDPAFMRKSGVSRDTKQAAA
ncbi:hypothetical protein V8Z69_10940 [Microbacterium aurugineum]|uniref:hypothetical protein n=1 Tax=Microbacterium aurugineum TaxID=2851642 RepID=UPI0039BE8044